MEYIKEKKILRLDIRNITLQIIEKFKNYGFEKQIDIDLIQYCDEIQFSLKRYYQVYDRLLHGIKYVDQKTYYDIEADFDIIGSMKYPEEITENYDNILQIDYYCEGDFYGSTFSKLSFKSYLLTVKKIQFLEKDRNQIVFDYLMELTQERQIKNKMHELFFMNKFAKRMNQLSIEQTQFKSKSWIDKNYIQKELQQFLF